MHTQAWRSGKKGAHTRVPDPRAVLCSDCPEPAGSQIDGCSTCTCCSAGMGLAWMPLGSMHQHSRRVGLALIAHTACIRAFIISSLHPSHQTLAASGSSG